MMKEEIRERRNSWRRDKKLFQSSKLFPDRKTKTKGKPDSRPIFPSISLELLGIF